MLDGEEEEEEEERRRKKMNKIEIFMFLVFSTLLKGQQSF